MIDPALIWRDEIKTVMAIPRAVYPMGEATASRQVMTAENGETMRNSTLAVANNEFGFDLFQQLKRQAANKNIFFSPLSVTMALAMAYNGAEGETKRAMARALRIQGPEDQGMDLAELNRESADFHDAPGDVKLPRFKLDYESTLNQALSNLGMDVAFTPRADFSGMRAERDLFISEVKHKAIVEVNEEGTEAAAVTSVGLTALGISNPPQRFTFIADRPFLMAIRDAQTGAILFIGAVMEPR